MTRIVVARWILLFNDCFSWSIVFQKTATLSPEAWDGTEAIPPAGFLRAAF
jgi:hypothetical protein